MANSSFSQRLRYRFDNFMSRGGSSIFLSLVVVFVVSFIALILMRGLIYLIYPEGGERIGGFFNHVYVIFLELTDPGNMNQEIGSDPVYKIPGVLAGLVGIVILSMLIAFITTALDQKLTQLKKGHSKVIEEDHTIILGWSNRVVEIVRELVIANESEDDGCVVILAEKDKEEMDDHLSMNLGDTKTTRVVTRSGAVSSLVNLDVVSVATCKSAIVLGECSEADPPEALSASDSRVIKTVLGLIAAKAPGQELNIVAELYYRRNRIIAERIAPNEVTTIDASDVLAKVMVQTSRSVGLSVVYSEIMSFDGCEMYFYGGPWPEIGFGALQFHFPDGIPLGIRRADGDLLINPSIDTTVMPGDEVLILAEDDSTIEYRPQPVATGRTLADSNQRLEHGVERQLIIGWNPKAEILIEQYADYVLAGSRIDILVQDPGDHVRIAVDRLRDKASELIIEIVDADPLHTETYEKLDPTRYDNVLILSQGVTNADPETIDSETIIILLVLRRLLDAAGPSAAKTSLISEVMNSRNQALVSRAGVNDFIISNRLVSMLLAQVSEQQDIKKVYDDLFEEDGSEIYLKPATLYFADLPIDVSYGDMMVAAQARAEVCMGVKIKADEADMDKNFGVKLIPEKTVKYHITAEDSLVVLAEDDT